MQNVLLKLNNFNAANKQTKIRATRRERERERESTRNENENEIKIRDSHREVERAGERGDNK